MPLASAPGYTALSYTWAGENARVGGFANFLLSITKAIRKDASFHPDETSGTDGSCNADRLIVCDNKRLLITQNLHDGLKSVCLSKSDTTCYWWIDQICINQADEVEKSLQVPMMGSIYRQSLRVAVWLGQGSSWEIRFLRHLPKLLGTLLIRGDPKFWDWTMDCAWACMSLANIGRRSWFRRVWIVQELALAGELTFFLGKYSISYEDLYQSMSWLFDTSACMGGTLILVEAIGFPRIARLLDTRKYFQNGDFWTITEWITAIRGHKAWDQRDYIFAGVSLFSEADRCAIRVDYSRTRRDVFMDVTRHLLSQQLGINTLSLAERGSTKESVPLIDRPTWEINADCAASRTSLLELGQGRFNACPITQTEDFTAGQDFLHTKALSIDKIKIVCSESLLDTGEGIEDLLQIILEMGQSYQWTGEDPLIALARTITADTLHVESPHWGDAQQTMVTFITTLAELSRGSHGQKDSQISPTSRFAATWPRYHDFNWSRDWIATHPWMQRLTGVVPSSDKLSTCIKSAILGRRLFMTERGMIGLGPVTTHQGQTVAILSGARIPYLFNSISVPLDVEDLSACDKALVARARSIHKADPAMIHLKVMEQIYVQCFKALWKARSDYFDNAEDRGTLEGLTSEFQERYCLENLPTEGGLFSSVQFVGEAYLHGFMYGEVEQLIQEGVVSWQQIDIQ